MKSNKVFAGVDIGGTKTAVVLSSNPPHILERIEFSSSADVLPDEVIQQIIAGILQMLTSRHMTPTDLIAIGVSCGSPLDQKNGIIQRPPNLPAWVEVPIKTILECEFAAPCFLENDANAGALAEWHYGAARETKHAVFLTMGTGIGAGLILNGAIYRGASLAAGELGHVRLTEDGPVGHDRAGTVEGWASGGGMARLAAKVVEHTTNSGEITSLSRIRGRRLSARDVWQASQAGDGLATEIVVATGERLGQALAMLIDILNPECIVVGGLAVRMGDALLGPARAIIEKEALPHSAKVCRIVPAELGEQIGDIAAICVAEEGNRHVS